jgi:hypothetical protein
MDIIESRLRSHIIDYHDEVIVDLVSNPEGWNSSRMDGALERRLSESLPILIEGILEDQAPSGKEWFFELDEMSLSIVPLTISVLSPSAGNLTDSPNGTGPYQYGWRSAAMGANSSVSIVLSCRSGNNGIEMKRSMEVNIVRESAMDVIYQRMDRFLSALEGPEFSELFQHMIASLGGAKAYFGRGMEMNQPDGSISPSLLEEDEIAYCLDLSVHLLARSYLGVFDSMGLEEIESILRSVEGSEGSSPSLLDLLDHNNGAVDPGMLIMVIEGLFSEESPPDAASILRPFLISLTERLALGLVDFMGLDTGIVQTFGGITGFFSDISHTMDDAIFDLFGVHVIDTRIQSVKQILNSFYLNSDLLSSSAGKLMISGLDGQKWNGDLVSGYPIVASSSIERTFDADILEADGFVKRYRIKADIHIPEFQPDFMEVDLFNNEFVIDGLAGVIGIDEGFISAEVALRESAEKVVRDSVERFIQKLAEKAPEIWDEIWKGWESDSPPPLDCEICPVSYLASLTLSSIPGVIDEFMEVLLSAPELVNLRDIANGFQSILGEPIADWLYENFDKIVSTQEQVLNALQTYSVSLPSRTDSDLISSKVIEVLPEGSDFLTFDDGTPLSIDVLKGSSEYLTILGLGLNGNLNPDFEEMVGSMIMDSIETVKERELGKGDTFPDMGFIRYAFLGEPTRGDEGSRWMSPLGINLSFFKKEMNNTLQSVWKGIMNDTSGAEMLSASRHFLPPMNRSGNVTLRKDFLPHGPVETIQPVIGISSKTPCNFSFIKTGGFHDPDPRYEGSPYRTDFEICASNTYSIQYGLNGSVPIIRSVLVNSVARITVHTAWPMRDAKYTEGITLYEMAMDKAKQASVKMAMELINTSSKIFPDTLTSLQEIPPLVSDLIDKGDLDLAEASRVLSNVTLDLSTSLREAVRNLVKHLVDMGLAGILSALLDILGIDEFEVEIPFGPLELTLRSEKEALFGNEGILLEMILDVASIGLYGHLSVNRIENSTVKFNGTVVIDKGPLFFRIELDPFMEDRPHMFSVEGTFGRENETGVGFSFAVPTLEEYKILEVSLSSSLGIEPMIPIPPIGCKAVIDGGFRLKYRMPEDIPPVLNEINMTELNITYVEIFNPRQHPMGGSTLEVRDPKGRMACSWILNGSVERYAIIELTSENLWRWEAGIPLEGPIRLILRSPAGLVMDEIHLEALSMGILARDRDGFGIWRLSDPTPGEENSDARSYSIRSIIISIALSSIKEAWNESYGMFGLSFETAGHFLKRSVELFMERFLALVSQLVIDARIFLKIEIEDASGTGGGGLELSLRAEGEAIALFLEWLYQNILIILDNIKDPRSAGEMRTFPIDILEKCWITLLIFSEVETPITLSDMASEDIEIPDSLTFGFSGSINLALPLDLMGCDVGLWRVSFGVLLVEAPPSIISIFYDVEEFDGTTDLWLLKGEIWEVDT